MSPSTLIVCVDHDSAALKVRTLILSHSGYRVLSAESEETALRLFRLNKVDLVIIDPPSPEATRSDVIDEMKRINPKLSVIVFTGLMDLPEGFEQADLVLTKCITPPEFLAAVAAVVLKLRASVTEGE